MGLRLEEQETTLTVDMEERLVRVYSSVPRDIRAMRKDASFTLVGEETMDGEVIAARFTIPDSEYSVVTGRKRHRAMSESERARRSEMARRNFQK